MIVPRHASLGRARNNERIPMPTNDAGRDRVSELEGRLSALELVLSLVLGAAGRSHYSSAWTPLSDVLLQKAIHELRQSLLGAASLEAQATLYQLFERSISGFQIENLRPDFPGVLEAPAKSADRHGRAAHPKRGL